MSVKIFKPFAAYVIADNFVLEGLGYFGTLEAAQLAAEARTNTPGGYNIVGRVVLDIENNRSYWVGIQPLKPRLDWVGGRDCGSTKA